MDVDHAEAAACGVGLCCCGERVGNTLRCCRGRVSIGPHYACNAVAWALILGITAAFNALVAVRLHWGVVVGDVISCAALCVAFALTSFTDPGFLPRQTPEQLEEQKAALERAPGAFQHDSGGGALSADPGPMLAYTPCTRCNVLRGRGTQHCYDCGLCVRELDHHCPWSGVCIAAGNIVYFRYFLGLLLLHCTITGVVSEQRKTSLHLNSSIFLTRTTSLTSYALLLNSSAFLFGCL